MIDFIGWPKISRLKRDCIITEKIDGTNASIYIADNCEPIECNGGRVVPFLVGSRTRWIYPESDNMGFCKWCYEHQEELLTLGPGSHFGEWWGGKIQRGYGMKEKRFSLFNTSRWTKDTLDSTKTLLPNCCDIVPILYSGIFSTEIVDSMVEYLRANGSVASPGFMKPEGVVVFLAANRSMYKVTLEKDHLPKALIEPGD